MRFRALKHFFQRFRTVPPSCEGSITESRLERLKAELLRRLDCAEDSVRVYKLQSLRYVELDQLGVASPVDSVVI